MKICFMCDLHLSYNKNTVQYDAFDWALTDIQREKADLVAVAGDFTADGNIFAAKRFIKRIRALDIPAVVITGNSDYRNVKNIPFVTELVSPTVNRFGNLTVLAVNDSEQQIDDETFGLLENAGENTLVLMHHPIGSLAEPSRSRFAAWRDAHPQTLVFCGHLHKSYVNGNTYGLQALDPDKASGENPCITYFDTETRELRKAYYFCPVPNDLLRYIGISCFDPLADITYAAEHGLRCIELRPNAMECDRSELLTRISAWRKAGGTNLAMHAPEIVCTENGVDNPELWDHFVGLAMYLSADRITLHVPLVSVENVGKNRALLDTIADFLAKRFAMLPNKCVVGVENMHMTPKDRPDATRRFGYLPEECVEFMKHLHGKCPRVVGLNLDIGHARNNAPFSQRIPLGTWYAEIGRYVVGYHVHQVVQTPDGMLNHQPITEFYGNLISLASFFRCWNVGMLAKAPVIFEIRGAGAYRPTVELFAEQKNRAVFDLHTHTLFSACGRDRPEKIITAAIENGVKILGITDHSYGIGERKPQYLKKMRELAPKYADRVRLLCGIEIPTKPELFDLANPAEIAEYDYCLIEHILDDDSLVGGDLLGFCKKMGIRCGIAHTDLFAYCDKYGYDAPEYMSKLAEQGIFWELNVCYDSVHFFREHAYVHEFMKNEEQQNTVREAGLAVSIGSDCHRREEYPGYRLHAAYDFLKEKNLRTADALFL